MWYRLAKTILLTATLSGLCLPVQANTTATAMPHSISQPQPPAGAASGVPRSTTGTPLRLAQTDLAVPQFIFTPDPALPPETPQVRIALVLPVLSDTLGPAAEAVRAGFMAAHERESEGIAVHLVETTDAAQDVLTGYTDAVAQHDIVVGPLTRSGVTAVVQSKAVSKPTIALTQKDIAASGDFDMPKQMLAVGLSLEEEARQAAIWAGADKRAAKAIVVATGAAWQRRVANAFTAQWQKQGLPFESIELNSAGGYLSAKGLMDLKNMLETEKETLLFVALDAQQARQVRATIGKTAPIYGTSQLNPYVLGGWSGEERATDMDGTRLLDIPWQLQRDHPAVMIYPRPVIGVDQKPNADLERLYALGIDAYRIAREVALKQTSFELDGVTGRLQVRFDQAAPFFQRTQQQAVYREGAVVPLAKSR